MGRQCSLERAHCESLTVFSLVDDPHEQHGRAVGEGSELDRDERRAVQRFRAEMEAALLLRRGGPAELGDLPAEDVEKLRALGYVD